MSLRLGDEIRIEGLTHKKYAHLNGSIGRVVKNDQRNEGRVVVKIAEGEISFKRENLIRTKKQSPLTARRPPAENKSAFASSSPGAEVKSEFKSIPGGSVTFGPSTPSNLVFLMQERESHEQEVTRKKNEVEELTKAVTQWKGHILKTQAQVCILFYYLLSSNTIHVIQSIQVNEQQQKLDEYRQMAEQQAAVYTESINSQIQSRAKESEEVNAAQLKLSKEIPELPYRSKVMSYDIEIRNAAAKSVGNNTWLASSWKRRLELLREYCSPPEIETDPSCQVTVLGSGEPFKISFRKDDDIEDFVHQLRVDLQHVAGAGEPPLVFVCTPFDGDLPVNENYFEYFTKRFSDKTKKPSTSVLARRPLDGGWEHSSTNNFFTWKASQVRNYVVHSPTIPFLSGEYTDTNQTHNGMPVFISSVGYALFSDPHSRWKIGATDYIDQGLGLLKSEWPHGGKMPHQVVTWQILTPDTEMWVRDVGIAVNEMTDHGTIFE